MSRKLGEVLIDKQIIDAVQLKRALDVQLIYGGHLGTCLVELGFLDVDELGQVLAEQFRVGHAAREKLQAIEAPVLATLPAKLAERHQVVPFELVERMLHVAIVDPRNLLALDEISFVSGHRVEAWVAPEILVHRALERYYGVPRKLRHITVSGALGTDAPAPRRRRPRPAPVAPAPAARPDTPPAVAAPAAPVEIAPPASIEPTEAVVAPVEAAPIEHPREETPLSPPAEHRDAAELPPDVLAPLERFVEQSRPRAHLHAEGGSPADGKHSIAWIKNEKEGRQSWCELFGVPLEHRHFQKLAGVYVIWHSGHHPVIRVGQGYIKNELTTLRLDPRIASRNEESRLFVTWAAVDRDDRDGIERFLAEMLDPEIPAKRPEAEPIVVNLPC